MTGHRPHDPRDDGTPGVLPQVVITVTDDDTGELTVTLDGETVDPPAGHGPWQRDHLATILDTLTARRPVPLRVEIHEADGSTFTDILTPPDRPDAGPAQPPSHEGRGRLRGVVTGDGFTPGEQVAVAVVVLTTTAGPTGVARAWLSLAHTLQPTGDVILIGRISGTITTATPGGTDAPGTAG